MQLVAKILFYFFALCLLAMLLLSFTSCASFQEQRRINRALNDWREGRAEWNRENADLIKEVPQFKELP